MTNVSPLVISFGASRQNEDDDFHQIIIRGSGINKKNGRAKRDGRIETSVRCYSFIPGPMKNRLNIEFHRSVRCILDKTITETKKEAYSAVVHFLSGDREDKFD